MDCQTRETDLPSTCLPATTSPPAIEAVDFSAKPPPGVIRRFAGWISWGISGTFAILSMIVCLAFVAAIPIVQLITFGYLLEVAGGLARGNKLRDSLPHLEAFRKIGLIVGAVVIGAIPVQVLVHLESVAALIDPGSNQAGRMRVFAFIAAGLAMFYLLWALARGGRLIDFVWPQPLGMLRRAWRPSTYSKLPDRLWSFTRSLQLPKYFYLGLRGAIGTLLWLIPAMIIIAANRNGKTGLAGLVGFVAAFALGVVLMYLPMLQAHFASENRIRALFQVKRIRRLFCYAPWAWFGAMVLSLVLFPIPLYLLKIEALPREVAWLPTLVFVAFILPARLSAGLALRRAKRIAGQYDDGAIKPDTWTNFLSRWLVRLMMPLVVGIYLAFVTLSQYTSWDGLQTWVQQHAILVPIPFINGV
ncbi:DUF4013 domain-containing protein [Rhodopirellula sp. MGV]|uniref:DUF4013 domain-containing protein n=1 Tax=Rhodopirellula sp. MGV TaxID=2023130 RepID=UPI000B97941F|nr:DUF4013 domain-containing protein [Rhodopirellula sp. MGV]OYP34609.1 DUF4013 domain-containing protein [Rhodopirellula sp. MGV]PNY36761.1 DUF4013 domain-containing protein [Rhodopirellula baltica]